MSNPSNLMGNSALPNYIKLTATGILALTYLAALVVATTDMLTNQPVPTLASAIITAGLGMALPIIGIHSGASLNSNGGTHDASPPTP